VLASWNGKRAIHTAHREILTTGGRCVNVQAKVFGNMGATSRPGGISRYPPTATTLFYGECWSTRPGRGRGRGDTYSQPAHEVTKNRAEPPPLPSLETANAEVYRELDAIRVRLERHYKDMQDIEFTIQEGRLWMLQCRVGKRTGTAALTCHGYA
jgi:pyruvate,orthophosphate dikinase